MPRKIKKIITYLFILLLFVVIGSFSSVNKLYAVECTGWAEDGSDFPVGCTNTPTTTTTNSTYNLLAPLPNPGNNGTPMTSFDPTNVGGDTSGDALSKYLNMMIKLFIGICAVLAVIMIVMGGIEYMTSELISSKQAGKDRILHAIFGLILALGAWTLLNTINPKLLDSDLKSLANVTVEVTLSALPDGSYSSTGGAGAGGGGNCNVQTNPSNACSPTNLSSCFGSRATEASKICNLESGGGQTGVESGSDRLNNGTGPAYSVGLWQINLTVHKIGDLNCPSAFTGTCGKGTATPSNGGPFVGGPKVGNCSVKIKDQTLYNKCVAAAKDPAKNTAVSCNLYKQSSFKPWAYSANKCSVST